MFFSPVPASRPEALQVPSVLRDVFHQVEPRAPPCEEAWAERAGPCHTADDGPAL